MAITSILSNIPAQAAAISIHHAIDEIKTSAIRLSSGQRITQASDDASALAIGTGLATDKTTLDAALTTTTQATAMLSIADGGMANTASILARLKALAAQANNGNFAAPDLGYIKKEMDALVAQVDTVVTTTKFNGNILLDGTFSNKTFQVGLSTTDTISISFNALDANALGIDSIDITAQGGVGAANDALDTAIALLQSYRAQIGADQSRFGFAAANIETAILNTSAGLSVYLDADFASTSTAFASQQARFQAGIATLATVNSLPSNLLKLIG